MGLLAALAVSGPSLAHRTNLTTAQVIVADNVVDYRLSVAPHDLAVALGIETNLIAPVPQSAFEARRDWLDQYVAMRLRVANDGTPCPPDPIGIDYSQLPQELGLEISYRCDAPVVFLSIGYYLFFDIDPKHRSLGRLVLPAGEEEFLFDRSVTTLEIAVDRPAPQLPWTVRFTRILLLGIEHILVGYDHILFLLALLVMAARLWETIKVVTAFTLSHSLTLGLAWFGVIALPTRLVESAIAVSIMYVATENILGKGFRRRWLVAGGFGLVHGLGFYAVLSRLDLGGTDTVTTLLAFNLGVEIGQLAIVAIAFGPLVWWGRQPWHLRSARAGSGAILLVASWWLVQRLFLR